MRILSDSFLVLASLGLGFDSLIEQSDASPWDGMGSAMV